MNRKTKTLIKLDYICNNNCYFCWQDRHGLGSKKGKISSKDLEIKEKIRKVKKNTDTEILVFSGGEPTTRESLIELASYVDKTGLKLGLATNLRALSSKKLLKSLEKKGLEWVYGTFLTKNRKKYQKITKTDGLGQNLAGLHNVLQSDVDHLINLVVTRESIDDVVGNIGYLSDQGVNNVKISSVEPVFNKEVDPVPVKKVCNQLKKVFSEFEDELNIFFEGVPFCLLDKPDKFIEFKEIGVKYMSEPYEKDIYEVGTKHGKIEKCKKCSKYGECPGFYKTYTEKKKTEVEKIVGKNRFN